MAAQIAQRFVATSAAAVVLGLTTLPARADFTFTDGGKPAPAAELTKFFSGTSWAWPCKGCGAYFAPDGTFTAVWVEKGDPQVYHGNWTAKEGALCWTSKMFTKSGAQDKDEACKEAKFGPGTDGGRKAKEALGLIKGDKSGFFWVWQDKQIWKDFKKGDHITASAAKIEANFPKQ